jgi:ribosomal protein S18 acetylase RimI-like enzyme
MLTIARANLVTARDRLAAAQLLTDYAAEMGSPLTRPADEVLDQLRDTPHARIWLAWDASEPVGLLIAFQTLSTFTGEGVLNIHDLAVRSDRRGQGIGTQLLTAVAAEAREAGCCKLTLEVRDDLATAHRLYRRIGFGDPSRRPTRFLEWPL